ncbi:hypothetical protein BDZ45DRAFT_733054 [Acephala macrosclerotiorum]|nr:hypothetical protein BDZ45DRAFT_733054 [Acephala macrosclerotiorum]
MASQPSLLTLPRELRDQILHLIVSSRQTPQRDASTLPLRTNLHDFKTRSWFPGAFVLYVCHGNRIAHFPTLLVDCQLHTETLEAIEKLKDRREYELDVLLVNEQELWPTWTYMPKWLRRVEQVYARFRICGVFRKGRYGNCLQRYENAFEGPESHSIRWGLWNLLERFLRLGAVGQRARRNRTDKNIVLENLVIDVWSPQISKEEKKATRGRTHHEIVQLRNSTRNEYLTTARNVAVEIGSELYHLLRMCYHSASYGRLLYERIGNIKVLVDGRLRREFNLAEMLRDSSIDRLKKRTALRPRFFLNWKLDTFESRRTAGLPVNDLDQDQLERLRQMDHAE